MHALQSLDGLPLGDFHLRLTTLQQLGYTEQKRFAFHLVDADGCVSDREVLSGLYSAGRPSHFIDGWIDAVVCDHALFAGPSLLAPEFYEFAVDGLLADMFRSLGRLIPPNGRLWLAYEMFSDEGASHLDTRRALALHFPLVVTPIGYLLFHAGCWLGLRDWYIPEGWREGPRKLQGNKALNREHAERRATETARELLSFLRREPDPAPDLVHSGRQRAIHVLEFLQGYVVEPDLARQIGQELGPV